jgi:hypothetical protein
VAGVWFLWAGGAAGRALEAHGTPVDGTITVVAPQRVNGGGNERGRVTFAFSFGGEDRTATNTVGGNILSYHVGDPARVLVDASDPAGARLASETDRPGWEVPGFLLLGAAGSLLGWGAVRARAWRRITRVLDAEPWLAVHSRVDQMAVGGAGGAKVIGVVALQREPGDDERVVTSRGLRRPTGAFEPLAWVAGWGTSHMVVAPPGGALLLEVRSVEPGVPDRATGGTER